MYVEIIKDKLRKAREDAGYTLQQAADHIGTTEGTLSKYENGKLKPNLEKLCELIDFYEVSADWVLGTGKRK